MLFRVAKLLGEGPQSCSGLFLPNVLVMPEPPRRQGGPRGAPDPNPHLQESGPHHPIQLRREGDVGGLGKSLEAKRLKVTRRIKARFFSNCPPLGCPPGRREPFVSASFLPSTLGSNKQRLALQLAHAPSSARGVCCADLRGPPVAKRSNDDREERGGCKQLSLHVRQGAVGTNWQSRANE